MRWFAGLFVGLVLGHAAVASEPEPCRTVRFADIGWTDITATTAVASRILQGLGYAPTTQILSVPVTYVSMKNKDIDVFLGNWMPTMQADRAPVPSAAGASMWCGPNLAGARYTLAVPAATYDAGLHSFADIVHFRDQLGGKIYGIEPGNDGNRVVLGMIKEGKFGLGRFRPRGIERAGHAGAVRPRHQAASDDGVPRMGTASDEHQIRHKIS